MTDLFTVEQVAEKLHLNPFTVRQFYREGRINGARVGKRILFSEDDVAAFLAARRNVKRGVGKM